MRVIGPFTLLAFLAALFIIAYSYNFATSSVIDALKPAPSAQTAVDSAVSKMSQNLQLVLMLFAAVAVVSALVYGYKQVRDVR
ncbi:MAG: hypothetical protein QXT27_02800 [Pyrobaculum sp.]